jgi:hypothetical protein
VPEANTRAAPALRLRHEWCLKRRTIYSSKKRTADVRGQHLLLNIPSGLGNQTTTAPNARSSVAERQCLRFLSPFADAVPLLIDPTRDRLPEPPSQPREKTGEFSPARRLLRQARHEWCLKRRTIYSSKKRTADVRGQHLLLNIPSGLGNERQNRQTSSQTNRRKHDKEEVFQCENRQVEDVR